MNGDPYFSNFDGRPVGGHVKIRSVLYSGGTFVVIFLLLE